MFYFKNNNKVYILYKYSEFNLRGKKFRDNKLKKKYLKNIQYYNYKSIEYYNNIYTQSKKSTNNSN